MFCDGLTSIEIPSSVTSIGKDAFYNNTGLTSVMFGENSQLESIGNSAFFGCSSLTNIEIPDSVTSIGKYAFKGCSSLTSIVIPSSVTSIGESAFSNCSSLTIYCVAESEPSGWDSRWNDSDRPVVWNCTECGVTENGVEWGLTKEGVITIAGYSGTSTEVIIPETINGHSVTSIGERAFWKCNSLTSIEIPSSVTSIGERAFWNCNNLTIYCEATSKPSGWDSDWNPDDRPVVWGYKG
jgi:hypothetical protein